MTRRKRTDPWLQGYACAMADIIRTNHLYDAVATAMKASGIKLDALVRANAEPRDTMTIVPAVRTNRPLRLRSLTAKPGTKPARRGASVGGTDPCACGHAPEEHGHDPEHPSSTACTECGGDCIAYEADKGGGR